MKPLTVALFFIHGARDQGVVHLRLEPRRAALQKRLFCEIFSGTGYFVLKFTIKVNFVKIVASVGVRVGQPQDWTVDSMLAGRPRNELITPEVLQLALHVKIWS
jgi:hypothetical protein